MNDGWRMFGAGCLGAIIGFVAAVAVSMSDAEDRQAERIARRIKEMS